MSSPSSVCFLSVALLISLVVPDSWALVINYFDVANSSPFNSSLMELLHLENYKKTIPAGFTDYGVGAYKFHKEPLPWGKAMKVCEGEGAHLVIINSQQEEDIMLSMFSKVPTAQIIGAAHGDAFSVGVHDHFNEGDYVTVQGKPLESVGFVHWQAGEPTGSDKENCVVIHRIGTLHDSSCAQSWAYICELN